MMSSNTNSKLHHTPAISPRNLISKVGYVMTFIWTIVLLAYIGLYVLLFIYILQLDSDHYTGLPEIGFHFHAFSGSVYFFLGSIQFVAPFRQRFPQIHRIFGYISYFMTAVTTFGVTFIVSAGAKAKEHAIFNTITFLIPFVLLNYLSLKAIVSYRDVELHRRLNIMAFGESVTIVFMRPAVTIISLVLPTRTFSQVLSLVLWFMFSWGMALSAIYTYYAHVKNANSRPRLQNNGDMMKVSVASNILHGEFLPVIAQQAKYLNSRTLWIQFKLEGNNAVYFPPGTHISLRVGKVVREYTPFNSKGDTFELLIRLVPKGEMSKVLNSVFKSGSVSEMKNENFFQVYGPIYPIPSRFGYLPKYDTDTSISKKDLISSGISNLIMVGSGTGVVPFLSISKSALKVKGDLTNLKLLALIGSDDNRGFEGFLEKEYQEMVGTSSDKSDLVTHVSNPGQVQPDEEKDAQNEIELQKKDLSSSSSSPSSKNKDRLEMVIRNDRFNYSNIEKWININPNETAVWVCGPPFMATVVKKEIVSKKVLKSDQVFIIGVEDR